MISIRNPFPTFAGLITISNQIIESGGLIIQNFQSDGKKMWGDLHDKILSDLNLQEDSKSSFLGDFINRFFDLFENYFLLDVDILFESQGVHLRKFLDLMLRLYDQLKRNNKAH